MKKSMLFLIIFSLCVLSVITCYANRGTEIVWSDGKNICTVNYGDVLHGVSLIDSSGRVIAEGYGNIEIISKGAEYAALKEEAGEGYFITLNADGTIERKEDYFEYKGNALRGLSDEELKALKRNSDDEYIHRKGKLLIAEKEKRFALLDAAGKNITDFKYDLAYIGWPAYYGKVLLSGEENFTLADAETGIILSDVIDIIFFEDYVSLIVCREDGKIKLRDYETLEILGKDFEEYKGQMSSCAALVKNGKNYVYDHHGVLLYEGDKDVRAVFAKSYVLWEDGRFYLCDVECIRRFPHGYEEIVLLNEKIWIAQENGRYNLMCENRKILENMSDIKCYGSLIYADYDVYDMEGKVIYNGNESETAYIVDNGIFIENHTEGTVKYLERENYAPTVKVNGKFLLADVVPRIKNGRTLVPLRAFAEMMEFQVKEPDEKGRIEISKDGKTVVFTLGSLEGEKDGEKFKLEAAPEIINNRTLVPLRALAEAFECEVLWNGETTEVVIRN